MVVGPQYDWFLTGFYVGSLRCNWFLIGFLRYNWFLFGFYFGSLCFNWFLIGVLGVQLVEPLDEPLKDTLGT